MYTPHMDSEELAPNVQLWTGDCLDVMPQMADGSIGLVLTDLPYGTTYASWDALIPFEPLWKEWKRLLRPNGAVVMTASQPFTSTCVMSNPKWFKCEWIWDKAYPTNFANAKRQPLKIHESVLVFGKGQTTYNPQMTKGVPNHKQGTSKTNTSELRLIQKRVADDLSGMKYPQSIIKVPRHSSACKWHSTQKPVELFEYLIRTYSVEGDIVLDCCAGSGTTGIAGLRSGRKTYLIEKKPEQANLIRARFQEEIHSNLPSMAVEEEPEEESIMDLFQRLSGDDE